MPVGNVSARDEFKGLNKFSQDGCIGNQPQFVANPIISSDINNAGASHGLGNN